MMFSRFLFVVLGSCLFFSLSNATTTGTFNAAITTQKVVSVSVLGSVRFPDISTDGARGTLTMSCGSDGSASVSIPSSLDGHWISGENQQCAQVEISGSAGSSVNVSTLCNFSWANGPSNVLIKAYAYGVEYPGTVLILPVSLYLGGEVSLLGSVRSTGFTHQCSVSVQY